MLSKIQTLIRTVRHLKVTQLQYRLRYLFLAKLNIDQKPAPVKSSVDFFELEFTGKPNAYTASVKENGEFSYLNKSHKFDIDNIDWNYAAYGKLWTYNLNYFECLHQNNLSTEFKLKLLLHYCQYRPLLIDGLEPYPISLRLINTIRFLSTVQNVEEKEKIAATLYSDASYLRGKLEYHLLGNHLLENGFALLMAAYFFKNQAWLNKAKQILRAELKEQIQADGAHFEQSPMYHCIILYRVLETVDLLQNNPWQKDNDFYRFIEAIALQMIGWLQSMTFANGQIPMLNDSAHHIAPYPHELANYALKLKLAPANSHSLGESGYRMWKDGDWEVLIDAGKVANDYQPGHAHADTFSFVMHYKQKPIIVDTGTSTYEKNDVRQQERSTLAHNTVAYAGLDSSEVWGGFRVGRRAKVNIIKEGNYYLSAVHDGYKHLGATHQRAFSLENDLLEIKDVIIHKQSLSSIYSLHFHPERMVTLEGNKAIIDHLIQINFENIHDLQLESYLFAVGFNKQRKAFKIVGNITDKAHIKISLI